MRDGRTAKIKSKCSGMPEWPFEVEAASGDERSFTVRYDGTQEYHPHTKSPMDLMFRLSPCKSKTKKGKTPMPKKTPNKYFVGQLDKPKRGLPFRIFRQRKSMLGTIIDEVCLKTGWKRMKTGYKRVGPFLK